MSEQTNDAGVATAAYAAGKAEAVATDAHQGAQEATEKAETAEAIAEGARESAWSAQDAVAELREEMRAGLDSVMALISEATKPKDNAGDGDGPKAPASKAEAAASEQEAKPDTAAKPKDTTAGAKPKRAKGWFAGR